MLPANPTAAHLAVKADPGSEPEFFDTEVTEETPRKRRGREPLINAIGR
jgi:hypothetical protein